MGKSVQKYHQNKLFVVSWKTEYNHISVSDDTFFDNPSDITNLCDNPSDINDFCDNSSKRSNDYCCNMKGVTCSNDLQEEYEGRVPMQSVNSAMYLGHFISNRNDNMVHIQYVKGKSIGIIKSIFIYLNKLNLGKFNFECGIILMKSLLRTSILYSIETVYNLQESEMRQIEQIEEQYLRQLINTQKGCPLSQLYLEFGVYPARFEAMKLRILFYNYIQNQPKEYMLNQFLQIQKLNLVYLVYLV